MSIFQKTTVIIPSLNPDEKLMKVICGLEEEGFDDIIVVNDGSSPDKLLNFPDPKEHPACTVLTHEVNRGKGAALKTAFEYFLKNRTDRLGVVTVDGDNQHRPEDVKKCAEKMLESSALVLGVRNFDLPHVPKRSRVGNKITSSVFRVCCGLKISDTQTGLRAFPCDILPQMLEVSGDRFEYETNMLLSLSTYGIRYEEVTIETIYIEENQTSHFRPVRDSIRIYSLILKFIASSLISSGLDLLIFFISHLILDGILGNSATFVCTFLARAVSSAFNFIINKKKVFGSSASIGSAVVKYYALAVAIMLISSGAVWSFSNLLNISSSFVTTLIKAVVDIILFICSFRIQREWVFAATKKGVKN